MPLPKLSVRILFLFTITASFGLSGCVPWAKGLRTLDDSITDWRDFVWGKRAYTRRYGRSMSKPFMEGFLEGYHDMLQGGDGCLPVVPPRRYWGWRYQSSGGQSAISDWFNGYAAGVDASREDGLANVARIPTSNDFDVECILPMGPDSSIGSGLKGHGPEDPAGSAPAEEFKPVPESPSIQPGKTTLKNKTTKTAKKKAASTFKNTQASFETPETKLRPIPVTRMENRTGTSEVPIISGRTW